MVQPMRVAVRGPTWNDNVPPITIEKGKQPERREDDLKEAGQFLVDNGNHSPRKTHLETSGPT